MRLRNPAVTFGLDLPPEEFNRRWLLCTAVQAFERGRIDRDEFASRAVTELALAYGSDEFVRRFNHWPDSIFPGAADMLRTISQVSAVAILSNTNAMHWQRPDIRDEILPAVDRAFLSFETGHVKPDPAAFEQVTRHYGCKPDAVFFIDDNPLNTDAACRFGMQATTCQGLQSVRAGLRDAGILTAD